MKDRKQEKGKVKRVLIGSAAHLAAAIAGGFTGAALGRHSLAAGIPCIIGGQTMLEFDKTEHYGEFLTSFGSGMVTAMVANNTPQTTETGLSGFVSDMKERVKSFGKGMVRKTYLDNVPAIAKATGLSGTQYFDPSGNKVSQERANDIIKRLRQGSKSSPVNGMGCGPAMNGNPFTQFAGLNGNPFTQFA